MRNRAMSGLTNRGGVWHIDKQYEELAFAKALEQVTFARAQEHLAKRSDNYFDSRRGGEGLRDRVPQNSRNHMAASSCERCKCLK